VQLDRKQRLSHFGPELGAFLDKIWSVRSTIDLKKFDRGCNRIYLLYSGTTPDAPFDSGKLQAFLDQLTRVAVGCHIKCQAVGKTLGDLTIGERTSALSTLPGCAAARAMVPSEDCRSLRASGAASIFRAAVPEAAKLR